MQHAHFRGQYMLTAEQCAAWIGRPTCSEQAGADVEGRGAIQSHRTVVSYV